MIAPGIAALTRAKRASARRHRRSVRLGGHALPLDDHPIGLRLAVNVEIERRALVGIAEIEVTAGQRDLVALRRASRNDLARGRNDAASAMFSSGAAWPGCHFAKAE